jgi:AcrR family transcriptional regulator
MSHDVIKRVGKRAYLYRVESRRDPESGKLRPRWTYLGVAPGADAGNETPSAPVIPSRAPRTTRSRLLDAFERIAEREPYASMTAAAVAVEAGLAHGTFYRYFRDKRDIFESALERVREDLARIAPSFDPPYGSRAQERRRMRAWLSAIFAKPADHPGVMRAFYDALEGDAQLRAAREMRRRERVESLARYLSALAAAGLISPVRAGPLASALLTLVEATFRGAIVSGESSDAATAVIGAIDAFDRAIFEAGAEAAEPPVEETVADENGAERAASVAAPASSTMETRSPEPYVQYPT